MVSTGPETNLEYECIHDERDPSGKMRAQFRVTCKRCRVNMLGWSSIPKGEKFPGWESDEMRMFCLKHWEH